MNIKIHLSIFRDCDMIDGLVADRNSVGTSFSTLFLFMGLASLLDQKNGWTWKCLVIPIQNARPHQLCSVPACHSRQEFLV